MPRPLPIIEPFRIKSTEPIHLTTREQRVGLLEKAGGNLFKLLSDDVLIDLLTDSGTGAMSTEQWASIMRADESYAGARSFLRFQEAVRDLTGYEEVIPTHQGRAAEHLLFRSVLSAGQIVPNNTHFDTTRANIEDTGAQALDLPCPEAADRTSDEPFKGNMDLVRLEELLISKGHRVPMVMITITNNAGGGQPASLHHIRELSALCKVHSKPLFIDACRFAENAWLIKEREQAEAHRSPRDIAHEIFCLADGCTMSAKKDGLANIGGFLALRDGELATRLRQRLVVTEGFPTYGGLSGRDMEAVAQGLVEVLEEDYLAYRCATVRYVVRELVEAGIPVVRPAGGHAVFLDAAACLPHLSPGDYPGQALAMELYLEGGIRSCEIGTVMLGRIDPATGTEQPAPAELVRLALPRRTYTQTHMDYVLAIIERVFERRDQVQGVRIASAPNVLRHFSASFTRIAASQVGVG
ncbi:MAG: tyrosine phenol-lyase [Planctomycetota bacterium]|jgi:tyrosine phenol-lyase